MKAENELQFMMDFCGDLFYTRQKCLDHLFVCIGTGYEWKNGELVYEPDGDDRAFRWTVVKDIEYAQPAPFILEIGLMKEQIHNNILKKKGVLDIADRKWSEICMEYSPICNYPDDIKPDWFKILNECKEMLKEDGIEVPENNGYSYPDEEYEC